MGCGASNANSSVSNARSTSPINHHSPTQARRAPTAMNTPMASQPVTLPRPFRHGAPITQGDLNNMRTEFWTSRVDGNHQMWQTLRSACDALLEEDLGLANAILDAASLITPNGTLEIVYDERGHQYKLAPYVYSKPEELTSNIPFDSSTNATHPTQTVISSKSGTESQKTGSGKNGANSLPTAPAPGGVPLKFRIRINPGDYTINVTLNSNCSIAHLKHHLADHGADENAALQGITVPRQRIIYMGKQLPDTLKLVDAKFDETKVVQVFLKPLPAAN